MSWELFLRKLDFSGWSVCVCRGNGGTGVGRVAGTVTVVCELKGDCISVLQDDWDVVGFVPFVSERLRRLMLGMSSQFDSCSFKAGVDAESRCCGDGGGSERARRTEWESLSGRILTVERLKSPAK